MIDALHGRLRVKHAQQRCRRIFVLVLLTLAVFEFGELIGMHVFYGASPVWSKSDRLMMARVYLWTEVVSSAVGYAIGGVLADRFGFKRPVAAALIGWCVFIIGGGIGYPPFTNLTSEIVTNVLRGFLVATAVAAMRITASGRRRAPAVVLLFLVATEARGLIGLYSDLFGRPARGAPADWQYPTFALGISGVSILLIWLFAFPKENMPTGPDLHSAGGRPRLPMPGGVMRVLCDPTAWGAVVVLVCSNFVYKFALGWRLWSLESVTRVDIDNRYLATIFVPPIASIAFAFWSDWIFRRTRSWVRARAPFIVGGFIVGGLLPQFLVNGMLPAAYVLTLSYQTEITATAGLGLGAMQIANLLVIDLAPRRTAGSYIGAVLTGCAATIGILLGPVRDAAPYSTQTISILVLSLATAGALASALLLSLGRPQDDQEQ